jgi:hypothetical protein
VTGRLVGGRQVDHVRRTTPSISASRLIWAHVARHTLGG